MSSLDTIIIIPILILIIIFTFSLFSFATQMSLDEMNYSRYFLLRVLNPASMNEKTPQNTMQIMNNDWLFYHSSYLANNSTLNNRVILPNMVTQFENKAVWQILRYNRTFLALANENSKIFMREVKDGEYSKE